MEVEVVGPKVSSKLHNSDEQRAVAKKTATARPQSIRNL